MSIIHYMIFQYDSEPVLIQWILIGFESILENALKHIYRIKSYGQNKTLNR